MGVAGIQRPGGNRGHRTECGDMEEGELKEWKAMSKKCSALKIPEGEFGGGGGGWP